MESVGEVFNSSINIFKDLKATMNKMRWQTEPIKKTDGISNIEKCNKWN